MDAREVELRRAIIDAPADVSLRRVYADHLLQRGDVRGEHIHLACGAATESEAAELRRRALWQHHGSTWVAADLGPVQQLKQRVHHYRNGFLSKLALNAADLDAATEVVLRHPIIELGIEKLTGLSGLADSPLLPRVRSLELDGRFTDHAELVAVLEAAPHLHALRLSTPSHHDDAVVWRALEQSEQCTRLEHLVLFGPMVTADRARMLARRMPRLRDLYIHRGFAEPDGLLALAGAMHPLERVALWDDLYNPSGLEDVHYAEALAAPWLQRVQELTLDVCNLESDVGLAKLPPTLTSLSIMGQDDPAAVHDALAGSFPELAYLAIGDNAVTDADLAGLARFPKLRTLNVGATPRLRGDFIAHAPAVDRLHLSGTSAADDLLAALATRPMRELALQHSSITIAGIDTLVHFPGFQELRHLTIGSRSLGKGVLELADGAFDKLEVLDLTGVLPSEVATCFTQDRWVHTPILQRRLSL